MRMTVIVPSRGRPQNVAALRQTWDQTIATDLVELVVAVDDDDPQLDNYLILEGHETIVGPRLRLGGTLNAMATRYAETSDAVGFLGDDHRLRTAGWDTLVLRTLDELKSGIVYGDDRFQGANLPTAWFMTSDIVRTLGYMVPPSLIHMYLDNAVKAYGEGMGRLQYLPEVVIEHMHPQAGKAGFDEHYQEAWAEMGPDHARWIQYRESGQLGADIEKMRGLI